MQDLRRVGSPPTPHRYLFTEVVGASLAHLARKRKEVVLPFSVLEVLRIGCALVSSRLEACALVTLHTLCYRPTRAHFAQAKPGFLSALHQVLLASAVAPCGALPHRACMCKRNGSHSASRQRFVKHNSGLRLGRGAACRIQLSSRAILCRACRGGNDRGRQPKHADFGSQLVPNLLGSILRLALRAYPPLGRHRSSPSASRAVSFINHRSTASPVASLCARAAQRG